MIRHSIHHRRPRGLSISKRACVREIEAVSKNGYGRFHATKPRKSAKYNPVSHWKVSDKGITGKRRATKDGSNTYHGSYYRL